MLANLVVGIVLIIAIISIIFIVMFFCSKPKAVRIVKNSYGNYFIEIKRLFVWDSLDTNEELSEFYTNSERVPYPFENVEDAYDAYHDIKKILSIK